MTTQSHSSHLQTRQQLDELDSLLQRMLALPTSSPELEPAMAEPLPADDFAPLPPTLPMAYGPRVAAMEDTPLQPWRRAQPVEEPPLAQPIDDPRDQLLTVTPIPYPYSMVYGQPVQQPSAAAPAPVPVSTGYTAPIWAQPTGDGEEGGSLFALPIAIINRTFDLLTYPLGPLGAWLRQPSGRNLLGGVGVLLLLAAIGWVAIDWFGGSLTR